MNVNVIGGNYNQIIGTILTGGTISFASNGVTKALDLGDGGLYGLITYGTAVAGSLTFLGAHQPGGPFVRVIDKTDGSHYDVVHPAGGFAVGADDLSILLPFRYVRVMFSAVQTNGLQFYITTRG